MKRLTDLGWVDYAPVCQVFVDHVLLGEHEMQVLRPLVLPVEDGLVDTEWVL